MKNALDNLDYDAFLDKVVSLIFYGSIAKKCALLCEYLVPVVHTLYGHVLQYQVVSAKVVAE
ncbi:hypothetical protein [Bartonella sp. TS25HLJMH]|uniref:hypothetical protein n=1 Tax=Bartonella sp. TS25HLJMH TaxID=3243576 RepID=UPI0035CFDD22